MENEKKEGDSSEAGNNPLTDAIIAAADEAEAIETDGEENESDESESYDDIREELEAALTGDLEFKGTFAFSKTYDDAPNPVVSLEGLGTIGLPLSERDAKALIESCIQAPFGKGERTIVDREVRDTWEMDGLKVKFRNPEWSLFISRVTKQVCETLGVYFEASKPHAELYKLLLYETGSHFLPHVDTEKTAGMFATIVVVLPTEFTGGDAHLSHSGTNTIFNTSLPSLAKTSVIAWYTDVTHEIKPITSGYRLALSYNLIHTTKAPRPAVSLREGSVGRLRQILQYWKKSDNSSPEKIIFKLEHKYASEGLSAAALKSKDAHIFGILDLLAKELGLCLGLAHIEHVLSGGADDHFGETWDVDFAEEPERVTSITNLVDPEGELIEEDCLEFDEDEEVIPEGFIETLAQGKCDDEEYEGYQGNYAGTLEKFYRRTALVIWPPSTRIGNGGGDRRAIRALELLEDPETEKPSDQQKEMFDYVCKTAPCLPADLNLKVLSWASRYWEEPELWTKAAKGFSGGKVTELLPLEEAVAAINDFGFSVVTEGLQSLIIGDNSNSSRFKFLSLLEEWAKGPASDSSKEDVLAFVAKMRSDVLDSLGPPDQTEMEMLTSQTIQCGGVIRLKDRVLPQILKVADAKFLQAYASYLHGALATLAEGVEETASLETIVTKLLKKQLKKTDLCQLHFIPQERPTYLLTAPGPRGIPNTANNFIKICLDCDNLDVAKDAIGVLTKLDGLNEDQVKHRAMKVLLPLAPLLRKTLESRDPRPQLPLGTFGKISLEHSLREVETKGGVFPAEAVGEMLDAIILTEDLTLLSSVLIGKMKSFKWNDRNWKSLISELGLRQSVPILDSASDSTIKTTIEDAAEGYAQQVAIPEASTYDAQRQYTEIKAIVQFCVKTGGERSLTVILTRLLQPNLTEPKYITQVLVPLTIDLRNLSHAYKLALSTEPFASSLRTIVGAWISKVLGPMPDATRAQPFLNRLQQWRCHCDPCRTARQMLIASPESTIVLDRIGAPKRKHVESELDSYARGAAVYETIRSSPQGLKITKTETIHQPVRWKSVQPQGLSLLKTIGDERVLKSIWGTHYGALTESMRTGKPMPHETLRRPLPQAGQQEGAVPTTRLQPPQPKAIPASSGSASKVHPPPPVTPAKRKLDDAPIAIIDLCTP